MNRAERRKMKKQGYNEQGKKVYKLTQDQLDDIVVKAIELKRTELVEQVTSTVTNTFLLFCLDVLHCKFNFGKMRLKRFKYFMDELSELITDEDCKTEEVREALEEKVDLEFMYRSIKPNEIYTEKHWGDYEQVTPYPQENKEE